MTHELTDAALLAEVARLARQSFAVTAELVAHLAEVDLRRLYLGLGFRSMFEYCTIQLGLSEGSAYNRIEAARLSRRFPRVLEALAAGRVNLTALRLLGPHLTVENGHALLEEAAGLGRTGVEHIVARLHPQPVPQPSLRRLPAPSRPVATAGAVPPPLQPLALKPVAPEVYRLVASMDSATRARWQRLRELLPGDDTAVLARVVEAALEALQKPKKEVAARPTAEHSRHVPAAVRREVERRDGGQCTFVARDGRRCSARRHLQCHHVVAWIAGGATTIDNLQLRCGPHNRHEATRLFAASRASAARPAGPPATSAGTAASPPA